MMKVPHLRIVVGMCAVAIIGYAGFSVWAVIYSKNESLIGDIIGTWKSFATAAFFFWIGASSGGKLKGPSDDLSFDGTSTQTRTTTETRKTTSDDQPIAVEHTDAVATTKPLHEARRSEDSEGRTDGPIEREIGE